MFAGLWGSCANRHYQKFTVGNLKIDLTITNLKEKDGYSREELYEMLALVRKEEKKQGWKVPEPKIA